MDRDLLDKFEQLKDAPVAIDLTSEVMVQIEKLCSRSQVALPAALGLVTILILGIVLFPQMREDDLDRAAETTRPITVVNSYPQNFSLYPSPYLHINPEKLMKGGVDRQ